MTTIKKSSLFSFALAAALVSVAWLPNALNAQTNTKTRVSSFEYTPAGLLSKEIIEPTSPQNCLQTTYSYDARGNKVSATASPCAGAAAPVTISAGVRTSSTTYNAIGQFAVSSANALGHTETRLFDARFGVVTQLTGPNMLATNWQYDSFGRKTKETRADGTYSTSSYQYCGNATQTASQPAQYVACPVLSTTGHTPAYVTTQSDYGTNNVLLSPAKLQYIDALGRVLRVQTQDFAGNTVIADTTYNSKGQIDQRSQPYIQGTTPVWTYYTYDALGRITQEYSYDSASTHPNKKAITAYTYDGLVTTSTQASGTAQATTKTSTKNAQGQVASVTDNAGQITRYSYDALGQLIQTNAAGSITTLSYNQRGQKTGMVDPAMGVWSYSYNAFGELVSQTDSLAQTSSMAYDLLGRMTSRREPDLISDWYYDKRLDGAACGKSVGKLCESRSDNRYYRAHNYDSLGRANTTSTMLDYQATTWPADISVTFDPTTGRLATKTWPTGYKAAYSYNARGYLTNMTATGSGMTTAKIDILNYDHLGRITQYKHGNNVVTNKTYTADTGRLTKIDAALQGAAAGAVQNMSYSYDSLSNLKTRLDANTGVSETFSYDSLNRLSLYTELGGSVSPPLSIETKYDVRGNLTYKSDVGQYWYDQARPNRLTNITLSAPSGATTPLTGTRKLAFAFDDYLPSAKTPTGGAALGNGNLMYTVSQDTVNSKHTVRFESYTSFNMPLEIKYANIGATEAPTAAQVYAKASDRTLSFVYGPEHQRIKQITTLTGNGTSAYQAGTVWYLNGEDGQSLTYEKEIKASGITEHKHYLQAAGITFAMYTNKKGTEFPATIVYTCQSGYTLKTGTSTCEKVIESASLISLGGCPGGVNNKFDPITKTCIEIQYVLGYNAISARTCYKGTMVNGGAFGCEYVFPKLPNVPASCNQWGTTIQDGSVCSYHRYCPDTGSAMLNETNAQGVKYIDANGVSFPFSNTVRNGPNCVVNYTPKYTYICAPGQQPIVTVIGAPPECPERFQKPPLVTTPSWNYYCPYGQTQIGTGITSTCRALLEVSAVTTYKCPAGSTSGMRSDLCMKLGLDSQQVSYFQQDHLGSTAVITDEAGKVVERLAYDPWGKRRFANGLADKLDAIVPITTDRGYTEHEHLDEVGVIHMNGRIYDPLVGRFMSADPFIQAPFELQSHNRYAYVMNNPLGYTDPSGYFSLGGIIGGISNTVSSAWQGASDSVTSISRQPYVSTAVAIGVAYYTGSVNGLGWSVTAAGATGAAAGAMTAGGNATQIVKAAAIGGLTAWGFEWAGTTGGEGKVGATSYTRYAAHAAVGCASSVASGGQCRQGAAAAVFGKWVTNHTPQDWGVAARGVAATAAGGVGSVIGGGKFENGAVTAAYGYLFNYLSGTFDKKTGTLTLKDSDTGKITTALVTSGGTFGAESIPNGTYDILNFGNSNDRYRLESVDSRYGDDTHDATGRTEFRLHPRGMNINLGCIAATDGNGWALISNAISSTESFPATVFSKPNRFGFGGGKPEAARKYGTISVF